MVSAGQVLDANRLSNYPKTLSSPGFYGGYTPFSDSYLAILRTGRHDSKSRILKIKIPSNK